MGLLKETFYTSSYVVSINKMGCKYFVRISNELGWHLFQNWFARFVYELSIYFFKLVSIDDLCGDLYELNRARLVWKRGLSLQMFLVELVCEWTTFCNWQKLKMLGFFMFHNTCTKTVLSSICFLKRYNRRR